MTVSYVCLFFESLFSSMLMPLLTLFLLFCTETDWKKSPYFYTATALWLIYFILLVITQFTDVIYYYTPDNIYHRGPFYAVLLIPPILLMGFNLLVLFRKWNSLFSRQKSGFIIYNVIPLVCMIVQMFFYGLLMTVFGSAVAAMIMLIMLLFEQYDIQIEQTKKIADLRMNNIVLQMRPHFIYNTLTSIYCMIEENPQKAQAVTLDFTKYLRNNFNSIANDEMIPFVKELEHAKAYLAVEKARFENMLFVEFDIPFVNFRLPPLTLQPIVENAVKHGIDPELKPLHITISTRATVTGNEIVVEDTGSGFSHDDNGDPHIALANIIERLHIMCKGTLTISDREGGGTVVKISIPT